MPLLQTDDALFQAGQHRPGRRRPLIWPSAQRLGEAVGERVRNGPVVAALLGAGLEVVVVASRAVKALRTRYGLAGNKADRSDAFVLADCLRTDGHRWPALRPDTPATQALRAAVRARQDLVATRVATANQLRAHLQVVHPGTVGLFAALDSPISLRFLERFPTPAQAAWLSARRMTAWLAAHAYCGRTPAPGWCAASGPHRTA